jgi:2-hydroxy-3-keto-5-methylthiopentenyl-1-phosphate phosphatase
MQYMIIERFKQDKVKELYQRFAEKGRMMPDGVNYINSWINEDVSICYQVMETESIDKLNEWIHNWNDLADFEVVPVISSAEAKQKVFAG